MKEVPTNGIFLKKIAIFGINFAQGAEQYGSRPESSYI